MTQNQNTPINEPAQYGLTIARETLSICLNLLGQLPYVQAKPIIADLEDQRDLQIQMANPQLIIDKLQRLQSEYSVVEQRYLQMFPQPQVQAQPAPPHEEDPVTAEMARMNLLDSAVEIHEAKLKADVPDEVKALDNVDAIAVLPQEPELDVKAEVVTAEDVRIEALATAEDIALDAELAEQKAIDAAPFARRAEDYHSPE